MSSMPNILLSPRLSRRRLQRTAIHSVHKAIKNGSLPPLNGQVQCADCAKEATEYDHRNYYKPLQVSPVCRSCNLKRGVGYPPIIYREKLPPKQMDFIGLNLEATVKLKLKALAKVSGRSLGALVRFILKQSLDGKGSL